MNKYGIYIILPSSPLILTFLPASRVSHDGEGIYWTDYLPSCRSSKPAVFIGNSIPRQTVSITSVKC